MVEKGGLGMGMGASAGISTGGSFSGMGGARGGFSRGGSLSVARGEGLGHGPSLSGVSRESGPLVGSSNFPGRRLGSNRGFESTGSEGFARDRTNTFISPFQRSQGIPMESAPVMLVDAASGGEDDERKRIEELRRKLEDLARAI
ncbi:MAG TPA: hypothetical protein VF189_02095 [Patescibacteria group bacterium]